MPLESRYSARVKRLDDAHELLDGPLDEQILDGNLRDLARVNRWLGGSGLSRAAVAPLLAGLAAPSLLDIGTGAADIPAALARSVPKHGPQLAISATDVRPEIVAAATTSVAASKVTVRLGRLEDERDGGFDVVHASLVLHHLEPAAAVSLLREMRRVARVGVVINDLQRGRRWALGVSLVGRAVGGGSSARGC